MALTKKYIQFMTHIVYILFLNYFVTQWSYKTMSIKNMYRFVTDLKHILIWTNIHGITDEGQVHVINEKCPYINCYFTENRSLFGNLGYFDAILFNARDVSAGARDLPRVRSENQRYIFAANDSADKYPVCSSTYENFFNWTWTYRFDSTIFFSFISIANIYSEDLGTHIRWLPLSEPINSYYKNQLVSKSKAAVIFLDQCESKSGREVFIKDLQKELSKYNLSVDIYGNCGKRKCKKKTMAPCYYRLRKMYFFYLALEESIAPDFITNEVIHAYSNNAVPIVRSGANLDKYLPPGSYINAMKLTIADLAKKMQYLIKNREVYYEYYRWKNVYTVTESKVLDACALCEKLNNKPYIYSITSYKTFRNWWNPDYESLCTNNRFFML